MADNDYNFKCQSTNHFTKRKYFEGNFHVEMIFQLSMQLFVMLFLNYIFVWGTLKFVIDWCVNVYC